MDGSRRYNSGTNLVQTTKEERVSSFERMIGDFSDRLFVGLKKLSASEMRELHRAVAERICQSTSS